MAYEPATLPPPGHPNTATPNPADFTPEAIETYTLGAPPDYGHPIANHISNIMFALGRSRSRNSQ